MTESTPDTVLLLMVTALEVCVQGIEDARAAAAGGADRIELCADLTVGGVTPSAGAVTVACRFGLPVQVLVRPRGGDFRPTRAEFAAMRHDVRTARKRGAAGIVIGLLRADGSVDRDRSARLIEIARPLSVTVHKAFDECADPLRALEELVRLGVDRVLTSGGAPTAREGLGRLGELARAAAGRITILAGGRITLADVPRLRSEGVEEIHVGSAVLTRARVDPARVRELAEAIRKP